ncbi:MAG: twin-arginine translocation signal domain-containing protein, partial [Isosphaeraceae bacterium]
MRLPDRRRFLHDTAALAAALVALPAGSTRASDNEDSGLSETECKAISANDILRIGVVGVHGRGMEHIEGFGHLKDVRITAI